MDTKKLTGDWIKSKWELGQVAAWTEDLFGRDITFIEIKSQSFDSIANMEQMKSWIRFNSGSYSTDDIWWMEYLDKLTIEDMFHLQMTIITDETQHDKQWYKFGVFCSNNSKIIEEYIEIVIPILSPKTYDQESDPYPADFEFIKQSILTWEQR